MQNKQPPLSALPISTEQLGRLQTAVGDFSSHQLAWLSGYLWGMVNQNSAVGETVPRYACPPRNSDHYFSLSNRQCPPPC